ncbi:uncharacterized protein F4822DRAFT_426683 [Hypoxylon trugodes]|uniref:uncharacterized protein n=1 Tax=Hypoxylon trugodes TaxID=326681 RepID=UPI002198C047|nr:uncharacterized protein F4822DRAFT_426683 [Hypoxylon trugodes]KAI1390836.1 hypothetical protein F4822DRAFT_426683 [Hypoxylon trugodes]
MQDDSTGKVFYSLCNSNGSAHIFPADDSVAFHFDENLAPKNGTSLAGVGYIDGDGLFAATWFQREGDEIVFHLWKCDATGHFTPYGTDNQRVIGEDQSVYSNTGLMGLNLGATAGYRVYFRNKNNELLVLWHTEERGVWDLQGDVSKDTVRRSAIGAGYFEIDRVTVVTPRDDKNIEVSDLQPNGTWIISTFLTPLVNVSRGSVRTINQFEPKLPPTNDTDAAYFELDTNVDPGWSLEAWDGNVGGLGLAVNDSTHSIFYIDNDSFLHCIMEVNGTWKMTQRQNESTWPRADAANARFATAYIPARNEVLIYYLSGGNLTHIHRTSEEEWKTAVPLLRYNDTVVEAPITSTGLSTGGKAGIGVGVSITGIGLLLIMAFLIARYHRKQRVEEIQDEKKATTADTNIPLSRPPVYYEMPDPHIHNGHACQEMPNRECAHEVPSDNNHQQDFIPMTDEEADTKP